MFLRPALALLLFAALTGASNANADPPRPLDPKPWTGAFPICATLPARIELDPRLDLVATGAAFLGDPVAYGLGLIVSSQRSERAERARATIQWPSDSAAFAAQLREALVAGLDTAVYGAIQLEGEAPADCPWRLRARSRAVFAQDLSGIHLLTMLHVEPREGSGEVAYASHLTLFVGMPEIANERSKGDREAAWPGVPEARVARLVADGYRLSARILSDDARERGAAPATRTTRRFQLMVGSSIQRGRLVKRTDDHYLLQSAIAHRVAVPTWLKEP